MATALLDSLLAVFDTVDANQSKCSCVSGDYLYDRNAFLEIIYPVVFEYLDCVSIRNVIASTDGFKFLPKCLMNRYWAKNQRIVRLNKYKIAERRIDKFDYEIIRINITSPSQFLSFYMENQEKFQQNLESKVLAYYIASKCRQFQWDFDEIEYEDLSLKVVTVDFWNAMSWISTVNKVTSTFNDDLVYFASSKPFIECVLWNECEFDELNDAQKLQKWKQSISAGKTDLQFGFSRKEMFENVRDQLFLPGLLSGGEIIKHWYCADCVCECKEGQTAFYQLFGLVDETNMNINGWDRESARTNYAEYMDEHILLKYLTFMMWKGIK